MTATLERLVPLLQRLDDRLERAVALVPHVYGPGADPYRGLHLGAEDLEPLFRRTPGEPTLHGLDTDLDDHEDPRLALLAERFRLSEFDVDLLLIALAPEVDLRYERIYAYLQDDVTRRRPTVDLALNLLCATSAERLARRAHVVADGAPMRLGLLHVVPDPHHVAPSWLAHYLVADDVTVRFLLGDEDIDPRVASFVRLDSPTRGLDDAIPVPGLPRLCEDARTRDERLIVYLEGGPHADPGAVARACAGALGRPLLTIALGSLRTAPDPERLARAAAAEARLRDALVYLDGVEAGAIDGRVAAVVSASTGVLLAGGCGRWDHRAMPDVPVCDVRVSPPGPVGRRRAWARDLAAAGVNVSPEDIDVLAGRFRLDTAEIARAVSSARTQARLQAVTSADGNLPRAALFAAARAQAGHDLAPLARRTASTESWDDLVLPADAVEQLHELCARVMNGPRVLDAWGVRDRLPLGTGVTALFAGPSGTGKSMAARIIARELGLDLHRIDLASVVSKYIGETEKNLDRVFTAAERANAILLFDEADALFGKRSEVRDAHDRYANLEVSYLLQQMEAYEGIAILTTNLRQHVDDAFTRRLAFVVHFPFPDEDHRRRIWNGIWPAATPLAPGVDANALARQFRLSGGHIRNVAVAAAFLAASDGGVVTLAHVEHAVRREQQKLGQVVAP